MTPSPISMAQNKHGVVLTARDFTPERLKGITTPRAAR
jgi:hypothetical protein